LGIGNLAMSTKGTPVVIELPEDFDDSDDLDGFELKVPYSAIKSDSYYRSLVESVMPIEKADLIYATPEKFMEQFLKGFETRIKSCTIEKKDQRKYSLVPMFTIPKLNAFFEKPCELIFDFVHDTHQKNLLKLTMQVLRSGQVVARFESKVGNQATVDELLDYLEHDFTTSYFLSKGHNYFPLGLARNLFGYVFGFLDPSFYEIKKTELGFDLIPYGKFKYLARTIRFSFWKRTELDKKHYVLRDSEDVLKTQMGVSLDFDLDLYLHRFKVEMTDPIRDRIFTDIAMVFDPWSVEHYLDYFGVIIPRHTPKLSLDQKNFLNALCKLYGEIKDTDKELRKKLELLIDKAFSQKSYTPEEQEMAVQIYKQYKDWGYTWQGVPKNE